MQLDHVGNSFHLRSPRCLAEHFLGKCQREKFIATHDFRNSEKVSTRTCVLHLIEIHDWAGRQRTISLKKSNLLVIVDFGGSKEAQSIKFSA